MKNNNNVVQNVTSLLFDMQDVGGNMLTKNELSDIMQPRMCDIIEHWDNSGLIIETQFEFANQYVLKNRSQTAYRIIVENGGHDIDSNGFDRPICSAFFIENEGYMYYFFDPCMIEIDDARNMVSCYFKNRHMRKQAF